MRKHPVHYQECMSLSSWDTGVTLHIASEYYIKDCQHLTIPMSCSYATYVMMLSYKS